MPLHWGGWAIGVVVTLVVLAVFRIPLQASDPVYARVTVVLFGLAVIIGLDRLLKTGFLSR
jgi:hypothetical protein